MESFNQLADSLLANQPPCSPLSECSFSTNEPSPANSQWLSSNPSSPGTSEQTFSSSSSTSSSASHCSSPLSSNPASVASSQSSLSGIIRKSGSGKGDRRLKNASAAEKYRNRVKGRRYTLVQQMDRELERGNRLRRDLASKLSLYREFVTLLANNTTQFDQDLASLGSKSLSSILSDTCCPPTSLDEEVRCELETRLNTFQQILHPNGTIFVQ